MAESETEFKFVTYYGYQRRLGKSRLRCLPGVRVIKPDGKVHGKEIGDVWFDEVD